jgi:hypothetical protein
MSFLVVHVLPLEAAEVRYEICFGRQKLTGHKVAKSKAREREQLSSVSCAIQGAVNFVRSTALLDSLVNLDYL